MSLATCDDRCCPFWALGIDSFGVDFFVSQLLQHHPRGTPSVLPGDPRLAGIALHCADILHRIASHRMWTADRIKWRAPPRRSAPRGCIVLIVLAVLAVLPCIEWIGCLHCIDCIAGRPHRSTRPTSTSLAAKPGALRRPVVRLTPTPSNYGLDLDLTLVPCPRR